MNKIIWNNERTITEQTAFKMSNIHVYKLYKNGLKPCGIYIILMDSGNHLIVEPNAEKKWEILKEIRYM
jgi:hypothetical protein